MSLDNNRIDLSPEVIEEITKQIEKVKKEKGLMKQPQRAYIPKENLDNALKLLGKAYQDIAHVRVHVMRIAMHYMNLTIIRSEYDPSKNVQTSIRLFSRR